MVHANAITTQSLMTKLMTFTRCPQRASRLPPSRANFNCCSWFLNKWSLRSLSEGDNLCPYAHLVIRPVRLSRIIGLPLALFPFLCDCAHACAFPAGLSSIPVYGSRRFHFLIPRPVCGHPTTCLSQALHYCHVRVTFTLLRALIMKRLARKIACCI